jgi:hypothetical protein
MAIDLPAAGKIGQGNTTPATEKRVKIAKDLTNSFFKKGGNWKERGGTGPEKFFAHDNYQLLPAITNFAN